MSIPSEEVFYELRYMGKEDDGLFSGMSEVKGFCKIGGEYSIACVLEGDSYRIISVVEK